MSTEIQISKKIAVLEEGALITPNVNQIDFVGNGVAASTVGNNVTVNIPGSTGSTTYYMNQSVNQAPYKEFSSVATLGVEQVVPATVLAGATSIIAEYQTPSGVPGTSQIPTGLWQFFLHFNAGTVGQNWIIRPSVYSRDLGGIETLLLVLDPVVVTNMPTVTTMYISDAVFPASTVLTTDRIVVKIAMENTTGVSQTVNFRTEGTQHYSVGLTTLNQVIPVAGVTAVTGTSPVVSSGGTTPAISMPQATASVNGYLAASDWSVFNAKQNAITLTTTGSSGASTLVGSTLNIPNYAGGAAGIFGISNSLGVYTYYATLTLAMAAATSGQVIEMFADVTETGAVTVTLKNGVNINGNGHTYTLSNTGISNALIDNAVAVTCEIYNIKIVRTLGTTPSNTNNLCLSITATTSVINCDGVFFRNTNGTCILNQGNLWGASATATNSSQGVIFSTGNVYNSYFESTNSYGLTVYSGTATNCTGIAGTSGDGISNSFAIANIYNCLGKSASGYGINIGSSKCFNSIGISTSGSGINGSTNSEFNQCIGMSTSGVGIGGNGYFAYQCRFISSSNYGAASGLQTEHYDCIHESTSSVAAFGYVGLKLYRGVAYSKWDNAAGHAFQQWTSGSGSVLNNVFLRTTNASANCINSGGVAATIGYSHNSYLGATTPISSFITQTLVNTEDNQGNIKL
jgi:hypothetical protein